MTRSSVRAWLESRTPQPPATLASKLAELVDGAPDAVFEGASMSAVAGALGNRVLHAVIERQKSAHDTAPDASRPPHDTSDAPPAGSRPGSADTALNLLAADALVTYSLEAASEEGTDVTVLATRILSGVGA